ncbi:MAG: hypothetical protein HQ515_13040 [Phycisphaeraceae bacterium]|nr:hypothetical protein [Phycisphaeraceae bacterium]
MRWLRGCLSVLAATLISGGRKKQPLTRRDLREAEFKTSTQGLGLRMTDHIRDVFRFRWLRRR